MATQPNIIWISLESFRYDHTSLSGYDRETTPHLARIAADSQATSFTDCITHGKWTGTSSASMLTGTTPPTHGIYGAGGYALSEEVATLPELLPEEYTTTSIVSNPNAGPAKGLDRGFDDVRYVTPSTMREAVGLRTMLKSVPQLWSHGGGLTTDIERHKGLSSYMMVDIAKRLLAERDDPTFTFLHFNSSHHSYLPPAVYRDRFTDGISASPREALDLAQSAYEDIHELIADGLTEAEWEAVTAMYDAVLAHVDHCVGELVDAVHDHNEETIVVITGDHGDLLGEYGLAAHKFAAHDALTRVPLVVSGLDAIDHQRENVVQHIDIVKTLFAQLGLDPAQLEGIDLTTETREYAVTQRSGENAEKNLRKVRDYDPTYAAPTAHLQTLTAIRSTEHKLLYSDDAVELFELPDESTDVAAEYPDVFEQMRSYAEEWLASHESRTTGTEQELDEEIKDHLSDMGYLV